MAKRHTPEELAEPMPMPYCINTERLRNMRRERELGRVDLAKMAQTSALTYSRWENGAVVPSYEEFDLLIAALGCAREDLLTDEPNPKYWY